MKRILFLIAFLFVVLGTQAQKGSVIEFTADTLKGIDTTIYIVELRAPNYDVLVIDHVFTNIGGTSDGTSTIYGSNNGTDYVFINGVGGGVLTASPVASITGSDLNQLTITTGLNAGWVITDIPWKFIKVESIGTTGDTTAVAGDYRYK